MGHDNRTFRLGKEMLIRMPSAKCYASKVEIEQTWLPKLSPHVSFEIPKPLHMGKPSDSYPYNWSIYQWIEGGSLNAIDKNSLNLNLIAKQLAQFINELHKIDTTNAPQSGKRTFYRGCSPKFYDEDTRKYIEQLRDIIDVKKALLVWEKATSSEWKRQPVWIHGDFAVGNIIIKDGKVNAIIDFGGIAIGDPACDLAMYWNFFDKQNRNIFKHNMNLDENTWNRGKVGHYGKLVLKLLIVKIITQVNR
ncbi:MAG: aminoglycoside phosphotransferase (APT) family kinase protein [Candidatus Deianiraeaceae bacterium]|jgi:aminoglycoside phosphotransferase (APT) family kinase protein